MQSARRPIPLLLVALLNPLPTACQAAPKGHEQLTGPFADARAVTAQCLRCHAPQGDGALRLLLLKIA